MTASGFLASQQRFGRLMDKVVLITGAAQGIGYSTARLASAEGARVVIADLQVEKGHQAAASIAGEFVELDVTDPSSAKEAVDWVIAEYGRIDVLINNAGWGVVATALETSLEQLKQILDIDLGGVFTLSKEVAPHMIATGSGSIVNLSSVTALIAITEPVSAYSAAKAGVAQLGRNLAAEWAPYGIRVNTVSPGRVRTQTMVDFTDEATRAVLSAQLPQRRLIEPEEVAEAVVFLASDAASAITGHNLVVDGGLTIV